jgi:hypothetical protein
METPTATSESVQRRVELRHAEIQTDATQVRRTAHFTDGSTRTVSMEWARLKRIAAFRRDVVTSPVLCVAISDPAAIVVLDESMDGWPSLLEALTLNSVISPDFDTWSNAVSASPSDACWTILFRSAH